MSRGATVDAIKPHSKIQIVPIDIFAWDVLQALQPYKGNVRKVAFFRYATPLPGLSHVGNILGMEIKEYLYKDKNQMRFQLLQLRPADVDLFVARGTLISQWANAMGFTTLEIIDNEISARRTLPEAVNIALARRAEQQRNARAEAILNAIGEGIIAYDAQGRIDLVTPSAERLLNCTKKRVLGKHINTIIPGIFSSAKIIPSKNEYGRIHDIRGTTVVMNRIPVLFQGEKTGAVCSFSDTGHLVRTEKNLQTKLQSKGFATRYCFEDIKTLSPHIRHLKKLGSLYAATDANLLIYGESGTGKELFAQSIHAASSRQQKPFVAVNCAAIPEGLLESELFGYEEGAFTGAKRQGKAGMFELAHTGTLFLDEIGDLPLSLQGRLLRVLQEREIVRVGGVHVLHLDVRILSATHQNLRHLIAEGRFRNDLYYRLNVLSLQLPPLRERPEDIVEIAVSHLQNHLKTSPGKKILTTQLRHALQSHSWPGNIRELLNTMERMAIVANHMEKIDDWERLLMQLYEDPPPDFNPHSPRMKGNLSLREHMEQEERTFIKKIVKHYDGHIGKAAKALGISRMTLWRKLQAHQEQK